VAKFFEGSGCAKRSKLPIKHLLMRSVIAVPFSRNGNGDNSASVVVP